MGVPARITTLPYELRTVQRPWMTDFANVLLYCVFGQFPSAFLDDDWSMEDQSWSWKFPYSSKSVKDYCTVECTNWGWSTGSAAPKYGSEKIVSSVSKVIPGKSLLWLGENSSQGLDFNSTEQLTLHQGRSVTVDKGLELTQDLKISGTLPGVGFEAEVSAGFKETFNTQTAEDESEDQTTSESVDYDFESYVSTLLKAASSDIQARGSVDVDGVPIWGAKVHTNMASRDAHERILTPLPELYNAFTDKRNRDFHQDSDSATMSWPSIEDIVTMLDGTNDRWPGFWDIDVPDKIRRLAHNLLLERKRRVVISGTVNRNYQSIPTFEPIDVTGQDPNDLAQKYGLDDGHILHPNTGLPMELTGRP